jgi:membrane-bound serine protease (ClpP class)
VDSGKVLTMTADEAMHWNYCEGLAESTDEVAQLISKGDDYTLKVYAPSWLDEVKGWLMSPVLQSLLILIIIGGIYFELQTTGIGFPSLAAIAAAVLYFAPLYVDGLAANWEVLVFVAGWLLLAVEVFVLPGFGVAGVGGILCIVVGLTVGLLDNDYFNFDGVADGATGKAALTVLIGLVCGFGLVLWLSHRIGAKGGMFRRVALQADLEGMTVVQDGESPVGKTGICLTALRPSGKVEIDGQAYDAGSESDFIEQGEAVKVVRFENSRIYVVRATR